jgi:hypothetical protein
MTFSNLKDRVLGSIKIYLYRVLWKVEKNLKSELYLSNSRKKIDMKSNMEFSKEYIEFLSDLISKPIVLNGPFKGLKYPDSKSFGSSLYPKLIGSYEIELEKYINKFIEKNYDKIFIIGCAEGYYCNGFGQKSPNSKIYCFDILNEAVNFCEDMASLNGNLNVSSIASLFDPQKFNITQEEKVLIICNIEGSEYDLFTQENINKFSNIDLLIECHDFYNVGLTQHLKNLFMDSHSAQQVFSIDDLYRPMAFTSRNFLPEYLNYVEKYKLLKEYRKAQMSWIVLSSK